MSVDRTSRLWNPAPGMHSSRGPGLWPLLCAASVGRLTRTRGIRVRLGKSGSKRGRWSRAEEARLRQLYGLRDDAAIARELKRPVDGVARAARRLFPGTGRSGPWTASETLELKRYLGATTPEVIARILGRSVEEVTAQIFELGRIQQDGVWPREDVAEFKRIYGTRTDDDLARIFGRTLAEVRRIAEEHSLSKDKTFMRKLRGQPATPMPRWKREELEVLRNSYAIESNLEIAKRLRRSVKSVVSKAHHLNLQKSPERLSEMGRENVSARYLST